MRHSTLTLLYILTFLRVGYAQMKVDTIMVKQEHLTYGYQSLQGAYERTIFPERFKDKAPKNRGKYIEGPIMVVNGKILTAAEREELDHRNDYLEKCKPCYEYYYLDGKLLSEGLCYSDCRVGIYKCYYPNGKLKMSGNFKTPEYDMKTKFEQEDCDKEHGQFIYYNIRGTIDSMVVYIEGIRQK